MSLLSKAEVQFLQGQKQQVSKSYEYKLKSILKKKLASLLDKENSHYFHPYFQICKNLLKIVKGGVLSIRRSLVQIPHFALIRMLDYTSSQICEM